MTIFHKIYYRIHKSVARPEERDDPSAGVLHNEVRTKVLELCDREQGHAVEVGCGEGLFLVKLAEKYPHLNICGIDNWEAILEVAKERLEKKGFKNVTVSRADALSLPLADQSFDLVVCINLVVNLPSEEHFRKCLRELDRICKKGGKIIFDVRNGDNPLLCLKYRLAKFYDETVKELPLKTYRLKKVLALLEEQDLDVLNVFRVGWPKNRFAPSLIIETKKGA